MNGYWKKIAIVFCIIASWAMIFLGAVMQLDPATANQLIIGAYAILTLALTKWAMTNGNGNGK